ncbi:MAG: hypothetical protein O2816_17700 [Planctomycetota bacterium]|nr:hypothetical protein [Planctomycetota bacterium]
MTLPLGTVPFLFLQIGLLVLVFSIGYLTGRDGKVSAAETDGAEIELQSRGGGPGNVRQGNAGGSQAPLTTPRPADDGSQAVGPPAASEADLAFRDPLNTFTVVVFTAENSDFGEQRAWAVHEYLNGKGYPVVQPLLWKGEVKIFVGAAQSKGSLKEIEARIRKDPGPNGGRPFYDAYVDKTERFR